MSQPQGALFLSFHSNFLAQIFDLNAAPINAEINSDPFEGLDFAQVLLFWFAIQQRRPIMKGKALCSGAQLKSCMRERGSVLTRTVGGQPSHTLADMMCQLWLMMNTDVRHGVFLGLALAVTGTLQAPRSGIVLLLVRDEQPVSPLRPKSAEMWMDFVWIEPINRCPAPANRGDRGSATELQKSVRSSPFETMEIDQKERAAPRRQAAAKNRASKHG